MNQPTPRKPRFIKPPNLFKQKVGGGGIDESLLSKSQEFIETNKVGMDFMSYAQGQLAEFSKQMTQARKDPANFKKTRLKITNPIMQLKANGGMFQYQLVSNIADIGLQFIEAIPDDKINGETFELLLGYENTLKAVIASNLKGDGGKEGEALVKELDKACKRYFTKYS